MAVELMAKSGKIDDIESYIQSISLQCPVNTVVIKNSNDLGGLYGMFQLGCFSACAFVTVFSFS